MKNFKVVVKLHGDDELSTIIKGETESDVKRSITPINGSNMLSIGSLLVPSPNVKSIEVLDNSNVDTTLIKFFLDGKARGTGVTTSNLNLALNNNGVFVGLHTKHLQERYPHITIIDLKELHKQRGTRKPHNNDPAIIREQKKKQDKSEVK